MASKTPSGRSPFPLRSRPCGPTPGRSGGSSSSDPLVRDRPRLHLEPGSGLRLPGTRAPSGADGDGHAHPGRIPDRAARRGERPGSGSEPGRAPRGVRVTLVVPELRVSTEKARALLPRTVPLQDAAANTARALALLYALQNRRPDLLADALHDVYHVPFRSRLIPSYARVAEAGRRAGAHGVTISGSGPTLLALHPPGKGRAVGAAMVRAFARARVRARASPGAS